MDSCLVKVWLEQSGTVRGRNLFWRNGFSNSLNEFERNFWELFFDSTNWEEKDSDCLSTFFIKNTSQTFIKRFSQPKNAIEIFPIKSFLNTKIFKNHIFLYIISEKNFQETFSNFRKKKVLDLNDWFNQTFIEEYFFLFLSYSRTAPDEFSSDFKLFPV